MRKIKPNILRKEVDLADQWVTFVRTTLCVHKRRKPRRMTHCQDCLFMAFIRSIRGFGPPMDTV